MEDKFSLFDAFGTVYFDYVDAMLKNLILAVGSRRAPRVPFFFGPQRPRGDSCLHSINNIFVDLSVVGRF